MEKFKCVFYLILCLFFADYFNFEINTNYLINESKFISTLINDYYGISNVLMDYLTTVDYKFIYDEEKRYSEIFYYQLEKDCYSLFIVEHKIVVNKAVLLTKRG